MHKMHFLKKKIVRQLADDFLCPVFLKVLRYLYYVGQHTNFLAVDFYNQLTQNLAQFTFFWSYGPFMR